MTNTFRPEALDATKTHEPKSEIYVPLADRSSVLGTADERHTTAANFLPHVVIDGAETSGPPAQSSQTEGGRHSMTSETTAPSPSSPSSEVHANPPPGQDDAQSESRRARTEIGEVRDDNDREAPAPSPKDWENMTSKQKDTWKSIFDREGTGIKHVVKPYRYNEGGLGWHKSVQDGQWSWVGYVGEEPKFPAPKDK